MTRLARIRDGVVAGVLVAFAPAQDLDVGARAFVEVDVAGRGAVFERELFRITLRFGVERTFLRENVVQPFRQDLDVPVRIEAPWFSDPGAGVIVEPVALPDDERGQTFVLEGRKERARRVADREADGRNFAVHELEWEVVARQAGEQTVPGPKLHLSYATRFREDFLDGRVPEDQQDATVVGADRTVRVEPLPAVGRPAGFCGAVGRFEVRVDVDRTELTVGQGFELALRIDGEGNTATFDTPEIGRLPGFHVRGRIEERSRSMRLVVHDIVPLREDVTAIPAIRFSFFDPTSPAEYRTVETEPIPVTVRPAPPGVHVELPPEVDVRRPVPGEDDIFGLKDAGALSDGPTSRPVSRGAVVAVLLLPWVLALGVLTWRRARVRAERARDRLRARGVYQTFVLRAERGEVADAFVDYLAARLTSSRAAVVSPDLARRLESAGVAPECAQRAAALLDGLVAARFGAASQSDVADALRSVVAEIEGDLRLEVVPQ